MPHPSKDLTRYQQSLLRKCLSTCVLNLLDLQTVFNEKARQRTPVVTAFLEPKVTLLADVGRDILNSSGLSGVQSEDLVKQIKKKVRSRLDRYRKS
jgi:hypothetical protein